MELAIKRLKHWQQVAVNTVRAEGEAAFERQVVTMDEWNRIKKRLVYILNYEGIVPWWDRNFRRADEHSRNQWQAI
jgi:uncharacterized protein involved in tellurium resistance